jgi:hypothetical protein
MTGKGARDENRTSNLFSWQSITIDLRTPWIEAIAFLSVIGGSNKDASVIGCEFRSI